MGTHARGSSAQSQLVVLLLCHLCHDLAPAPALLLPVAADAGPHVQPDAQAGAILDATVNGISIESQGQELLKGEKK